MNIKRNRIYHAVHGHETTKQVMKGFLDDGMFIRTFFEANTGQISDGRQRNATNKVHSFKAIERKDDQYSRGEPNTLHFCKILLL